jgi:hypothetical protein
MASEWHASAKTSISEMAAGSENGVSEKRKAKMAKMKAKRHETENNGAKENEMAAAMAKVNNGKMKLMAWHHGIAWRRA